MSVTVDQVPLIQQDQLHYTTLLFSTVWMEGTERSSCPLLYEGAKYKKGSPCGDDKQQCENEKSVKQI